MNRLKVVMVDFDGVLVESNGVKDKAFAELFADYPEYLDQILAYHRNSDVIRFEKFRHIYSQIIHKPYSDVIEKQLGEAFAAYCVQEISKAPSVVGALEFLSFFFNRCPIYLVSINPPTDLHIILKNRNIDHYFKGVYSVTGSKTAAIKEILTREYIQPNEAVFIGDSKGDWLSAQHAGVSFIGRYERYKFEPGVKVFNNMAEILNHLREKQ